MTHYGFPLQVSNTPSEFSNQPCPPYPVSPSPLHRAAGVHVPTIGFNIGPTSMSPPYVGIGQPSSTIGASCNPPYPLSPHHSGTISQESYSHSSYNNYPTAPSPVIHNPAYPRPPSSPNRPIPTRSQMSPPYAGNQRPTSPYHNIKSYNSPHSSPKHGYANAQLTSKKTPTVIPANPFSSQEDAVALKRAMKGFGADEKTIINIITRRSNAQRLEIGFQFKTLYGKDLIKELKRELDGSLEKVIVALMIPLPQYYAKKLHEAISGLGTDETVLIEVLCALSNDEIRIIREAYHKMYRKNLVDALESDTSGHFRHLMVSLCTAGRDESMVANLQSAQADARALLRAGELHIGTDESTFNMILCQRSHEQLRLIFQEYQKNTGHDIEKAIKKEFSGDIKNGLLAVIRSIKNKQAFFAKELHKNMKGLEANYSNLIRLIVTRCEIDMGDIKREYAANYRESLAYTIKCETAGNYRKCLLALIGEE